MSKLTKAQLLAENAGLQERLLRQHNFLYDMKCSLDSIEAEAHDKWAVQVKQLREMNANLSEERDDLEGSAYEQSIQAEQLERLLFKAVERINDEHYRATARAHNDRLSKLEKQTSGLGEIITDVCDLGEKLEHLVRDLEEEVRGIPMAGSDCDGCPKCGGEPQLASYPLTLAKGNEDAITLRFYNAAGEEKGEAHVRRDEVQVLAEAVIYGPGGSSSDAEPLGSSTLGVRRAPSARLSELRPRASASRALRRAPGYRP